MSGFASAPSQSRRGEPLQRSPSPHSSKQRYGVRGAAKELMMAANALNNVLAARYDGVRPHCVLTGSLEVHAAHVLPHSYWSSARIHEWLYYAGVIPDGGESTRQLAAFKHSERNILWLSSHLANLMEPTKGELIVMPELEMLTVKAEETLAAYEDDVALDFSCFTSPELLANCDGEVTAGSKSSSVYPYSIWLVDTKASLNFGMPEPILESLQLTTDGQTQLYKTITTRTIPLRYNPPLRRGYRWCLDPIIAGVVAWKAVHARMQDSRLSLTDRPTLDHLDRFLALCEADSPSGWRRGQATQDEGDRRQVLRSLPEENEAATEDDGTPIPTLEERWENCRAWLNENSHIKAFARLIEKLDAMEDRFVDDARRFVRCAFEGRARKDGFSRAMRWLRCDDDGSLAIDDEVRRIQTLWLTAALSVVAAWSEDDDDDPSRPAA